MTQPADQHPNNGPGDNGHDDNGHDDNGHDDGDDDRGNRGALMALGVVVVLILAGLWLTHILGGAASVQDCMAAGRTNCAPVHTGN